MITTRSASVKVMLSYNYCHFEISMTLEHEWNDDEGQADDGVTKEEIDNARKECMRLCDKAIEQYKIAKAVEIRKMQIQDDHDNAITYDRIQRKPKKEWTSEEKAKVKAYDDWKFEDQFEEYDYEDDYQYKE